MNTAMDAVEFEADEKIAGMRLDKALMRLMPELSLRAARRMLEDGAVFCNGQIRKPAYKVQSGDIIYIALPLEVNEPSNAKLIADTKDFYFFYKPVGMHSIKLAGRNNITLEGYAQNLGLPTTPIFLQRLDRGTAGIICAAKSEKAANFYRQLEKDGKIQKYYYAVLQNELEERIFAKSRLLTPKNSKVRISRTQGPERTWTLFEPLCNCLAPENAGKTSLARCVLHAGIRHQVRVHALSIGHPLLGDPIYGNARQETFILEHYRIRFGDYDVCWLNPDGHVARLYGAVIGENELKSLQDV